LGLRLINGLFLINQKRGTTMIKTIKIIVVLVIGLIAVACNNSSTGVEALQTHALNGFWKTDSLNLNLMIKNKDFTLCNDGDTIDGQILQNEGEVYYLLKSDKQTIKMYYNNDITLVIKDNVYRKQKSGDDFSNCKNK
jgi:hypothetical protein